MSSPYQTLPPEHIRILSVNGTQAVKTAEFPTSDLAIDCSLEVVSLADVGSDGTASRRSLLCNGVVKLVTLNLYNALWYLLRSSEELPLKLWVDALCINQDDPQDKNRQIPMMGTIYKNSVNVIVWLGTDIEQTSAKLDEFWERLGIWSSAERSCQSEVSSEDRKLSKGALRAGQIHLSRCDWFRRAWTLQEIVLAPNASVVQGRHSVSWGVLSEHTRVFLSDNDSDDGWSICIPPTGTNFERYDLRRRLDAIEDLRQDHPTSLMKLLDYSWDRASTDPCDRIYSLLGLCSSSWGFDIDYTLDSRLLRAQLFFTLSEEAGCVHSPLMLGFSDDNIKPEPVCQGQEVVGGVSWIPRWDVFNPRESEEYIDNWKAYEGKEDPNRLDLRALHPSFVLNFTLIHDRLIASGAVIDFTVDLWVDRNDKRRLVSEFGPRSMNCLQNFASEYTSAINQPKAGCFLDERMYRPIFQDASLIYQRIWDHFLGNCPCSLAAPHLLDFSRRIKARDEQKFLSEWKKARNEQKGWRMSWYCVVFGEMTPMTLEPHYNDATGQLACIMHQRCHGVYYGVIRDFYKGFIQNGAASQSSGGQAVGSTQRYTGVPEWRTPVDIPGKNNYPFCWLPTHFPIIGSMEDWTRFCS